MTMTIATYCRGYAVGAETMSPYAVAVANARIDRAAREREMLRHARDCDGCSADCTWCGVHGHDFQWHEGWE